MSKQFKMIELLEAFNDNNSTNIPLSKLLNSAEYTNCISPLSIPIGKDENGQVVIIDFDNIKNLLICGASGSGKTSAIFSILINLILQNNPENLNLICIDSMGVEYLPFLNTQYSLFKHEEISQEKILQVIDYIIQETYNRLKFNTQSPKIICVIDSFADIQSDFEIKNSNNLNKFINMIPLMNKVGIHIIISTTRPTKKIITDKVKEIFPNRLVFPLATSNDIQSLLDNANVEKICDYTLGSCLLKTKDNITLSKHCKNFRTSKYTIIQLKQKHITKLIVICFFLTYLALIASFVANCIVF